jgi:hypothetical protein
MVGDTKEVEMNSEAICGECGEERPEATDGR